MLLIMNGFLKRLVNLQEKFDRYLTKFITSITILRLSEFMKLVIWFLMINPNMRMKCSRLGCICRNSLITRMIPLFYQIFSNFLFFKISYDFIKKKTGPKGITFFQALANRAIRCSSYLPFHWMAIDKRSIKSKMETN